MTVGAHSFRLKEHMHRLKIEYYSDIGDINTHKDCDIN